MEAFKKYCESVSQVRSTNHFTKTGSGKLIMLSFKKHTNEFTKAATYVLHPSYVTLSNN